MPVSDSYNALTEKTMEAMKFAVGLNKKYDFMVKIDDDAFLRMDHLIAILRVIPNTKLYMGYFHKYIFTYFRTSLTQNT